MFGSTLASGLLGKGVVWQSPPSWSCLGEKKRNLQRGAPIEMSEPPQLAPFNRKEEQLLKEPTD